MHSQPSPSNGVTMQWLMDDAIQAEAGLSLARMIVQPGTTSEAHRHTNCSEAIHVLSGSIEQRCGDAWTRLDAGDTILIPIDAVHQTRNAGTDQAVMVIAYSSGSRVYDTARG